MCMGRVIRGTDFIRKSSNFRGLFTCVSSWLSYYVFVTFDENNNKKKTVKMSKHQDFDYGMGTGEANSEQTGNLKCRFLKASM